MERSNLEDLLPDDEVLLDRAKAWSKVLDKYERIEENDSSLLIADLTGISSEAEDDEEEEDKTESISPSEFEDNENNDDPNFNVRDVFNQTVQLIENRKKKWKENGIENIFDHFFGKEHNKVSNWLLDNTNMFSKQTSSERSLYVDQIHLQEKNFIVEGCSDQHSLESVDTAKYILSNRKRHKMKVMTKTIKQFRYGTDRSCGKNHVNHISSVLLRRKTIDIAPSMGVVGQKYEKDIPKYPQKQPKRLKYRRQKPKNRYSSDSSSNSSYTQEERSAMRKYRRKRRFSDRIPLCRPTVTESQSSTNATNKIENTTKELQNNANGAPEHSEIIFCEEEIINSTELPPSKEATTQKDDTIPDNFTTRCLTRMSTGKSSPIILHSPQTPKLTSNKKLRITGEYLEKMLGSEIKKNFLGNCENFVHEFDNNSKIIFIPPDDHITVTSDSEEDILEKMTKNDKGQLIEYVSLSK